MDRLTEQYTSQSPADRKDVDAARKAFKAELKNGPTKTVYYANGISGQKAFGNFDLALFHKAFDGDLDAAGALALFDDRGLLADRRRYGDLKAIQGDAGKYSRELWALQFSKSDYKLINAPAGAKPPTAGEMFDMLLRDPEFNQILDLPLSRLADVSEGRSPYKTVRGLFADAFGSQPAAGLRFGAMLRSTGLDGAGYGIVKKNLCAMFFAAAAMDRLLEVAESKGKAFSSRRCPGAGIRLSDVRSEWVSAHKVPLKIYLHFEIRSQTVVTRYLRLAFRPTLPESGDMADLPLFATMESGNRWADVDELRKLSDVTFRSLDAVADEYLA